MSNTNTRQNNRKPVTLKIKFKSGTLDEFIERYAVDISQGGIFIRTKDPLSVGTILKFEFLLKDSTPLIAGDGTVVWNREYDPARTGIPPGMGVRFDKLPTDSQGTLDTVLLRKSGSASATGTDDSPFGVAEPGDDYDPSGDFVDSPTRVAPADLVESLRGTDYDKSSDQQTPLPQPMPFHGDDDEFDESAFSESTRVVGVDELLASAGGADVFNKPSAPPVIAPVESVELDDYEDPFGDLNEDSAQQKKTPGLDLQSEFEATAESSPAAIPPASGELEEKVEESESANPSAPVETKAEAKVEVSAEVMSKAVAIPSIAKPNPDEGGSSMPWIAVAAVILLIGGVGGFWFLNKGKDQDNGTTQSKTVASTSAAQATDAAQALVPLAQSVDAAPAVVAKKQNVIVAVKQEGATVSVAGTSLSATSSAASPATFELEEGKSFTITITHNEFLAQSIDIVADGSELDVVVLSPKPRVLRLTSVPPGASVILNGARLKGVTPISVPLTGRQLRRSSMRVQMRLPKYRPLSQPFQLSAQDWVSEDESMTKQFEFKLANLPVRQLRPPRVNTPLKDGPPKIDPAKDDPIEVVPPKDDPPKDDPPKDDLPKDDTGGGTGDPAPDKTPVADPPKPAPKDGQEPTPDWMQ